jgi:hypothetical protein
VSFNRGFQKVSKSFGSGVSDALKQTVGDTFTLKGLRDAASEIKKSHSGKYKDLFKTESGRGELMHAIAKSAPSIGAASVYGYGAKKLIDKMRKKDYESQMSYYQQPYM